MSESVINIHTSDIKTFKTSLQYLLFLGNVGEFSSF